MKRKVRNKYTSRYIMSGEKTLDKQEIKNRKAQSSFYKRHLTKETPSVYQQNLQMLPNQL